MIQQSFKCEYHTRIVVFMFVLFCLEFFDDIAEQTKLLNVHAFSFECFHVFECFLKNISHVKYFCFGFLLLSVIIWCGNLSMAPVKKGDFTCREKTCLKKFTDRSNRDRQEKRFNHEQKAIRKGLEPLFDKDGKKFNCATTLCTFSSKFKGNVIRHMNGYEK